VRAAATNTDVLVEAFDRLEKVLPDRVRPLIRWLRSDRSRPVRIPLGILCIIASFFWFLPVVGLEFLPIGLLLIAQDVPFLRKPAGHLTLWLLDQFERLRAAWRRFRDKSRKRPQARGPHK
jgi:hypothetical protein